MANWIKKAVGNNKGALHRALGVPVSKKIPSKMLQRATSRGGKVGKEARLAVTLGRLRKRR